MKSLNLYIFILLGCLSFTYTAAQRPQEEVHNYRINSLFKDACALKNKAKYSQALQKLNEGLNIAENGEDLLLIAKSRYLQADIFLTMGMLDDALVL